MRAFLVLLVIALLALSIVILLALGLCLGTAHLMVYFVPALDLAGALVPAAILATTVIIMFASVFSAWFSAGIKDALRPPYGYDDDDGDEDEEEEYEPEPPLTRFRSYPIKKNRRSFQRSKKA